MAVTAEKKYVVFPFNTNNRHGFIIKNTFSANKESLIINDYNFYSFTSGGEEIVLISPDSIPLKLSISELFEKKKIPDGIIDGFDNKIKLITEDWIKEDGNPPEGYTYYRMDTILPYSEIKNAITINELEEL